MIPPTNAGWLKLNGRLAITTWLAEHQLLVVEVRGLVTPEVGAELVRKMKAGVQEHQPRGVLADYRSACMAADPRTMVDKMASGNREGRFLDELLPGVAVVSAGALPLWKHYSLLMATHCGVTRGAFNEDEDAWLWLRRQADVMEPERRRRLERA
jgi:hypothetical protein